MNIKHWLESILSDDKVWIAEVFIVVLITFAAAYVTRLILKHLEKKTQRSSTLWDDALVNALSKPLNLLILLVGLSFAAEIASKSSDLTLLGYVAKFREVGFIALLTWFLVLFVKNAESNLLDPRYASKPMDETTLRAIGKIVRISVIITAILIVMQSFGYSVSGLLAFGGIGGLAVGFAAKDLLANFFGGLMIYMDRPFAVGEWVRSPDREIEGTVEDIGWRLTRIRTFDKRPLYVPNSTFTQISVENPSRMSNRRIFETIGIRYDDAKRLPTIVDNVKAMLREHPDIDNNETLIVNFNTFGSSSLDFFIYTFTKTTDWIRYHEVKQEILIKILQIIDAEGAECAFPTSTVHIPEGLSLTQTT